MGPLAAQFEQRDTNGIRDFLLCLRRHLSLPLPERGIALFGHLDRAACLLPPGETALDMRDRFQAHALRNVSRERRTPSRCTMKDELLVLRKQLLVIRADGVNPEFQHAARGVQ